MLILIQITPDQETATWLAQQSGAVVAIFIGMAIIGALLIVLRYLWKAYTKEREARITMLQSQIDGLKQENDEKDEIIERKDQAIQELNDRLLSIGQANQQTLDVALALIPKLTGPK